MSRTLLQGYHWSAIQTTIHPFAVYFCVEGEGARRSRLQSRVYCAISDCLKHDTHTFHAMRSEFIKLFIPDIARSGVHVKRIVYLSDGSAGQVIAILQIKNKDKN